eukprot:484677-Pleurochrysis_carterae.AAC.1
MEIAIVRHHHTLSRAHLLRVSVSRSISVSHTHTRARAHTHTSSSRCDSARSPRSRVISSASTNTFSAARCPTICRNNRHAHMSMPTRMNQSPCTIRPSSPPHSP